MRDRGFKLSSIILLVVLLAGSIGAVCAQAGGLSAASGEDDVESLRLRAEILQRMLKRAMAANLSESLKENITRLLLVNLTVLNPDELKEFIQEAKILLHRIAESLREAEASRNETEVAARILERLMEKLNRTLSRLNVSSSELEEVKGLLQKAEEGNLTLREVRELAKTLRRLIIRYKAQNISEQLMNYTEAEAERGELHGLEVALNASCKVLEVLERVKEKLMSVNASPVAIAAIEHAIERITSARDVLKRVRERVEARLEFGNVTREEVRREVEAVLGEKLDDLNETIIEKVQRLEELREEAERLNLTSLAEELSQTIAMLEELMGGLASANLSFGDVMSRLAKTKTVIAHAEKVLEKALEEAEMAEKASEKLSKSLDKLREKLNDLKEKLKDLAGHVGAEEANKTLSEAENLLEEALKSIRRGELGSASKLLDEAGQLLRAAEHGIDHVKKIVEERSEHSERGRGRGLMH